MVLPEFVVMVVNNEIPMPGMIPCESLIVAAARADAQTRARGRASDRIVEDRRTAANASPQDRESTTAGAGAAKDLDPKDARPLEILRRVRAAQVKWGK